MRWSGEWFLMNWVWFFEDMFWIWSVISGVAGSILSSSFSGIGEGSFLAASVLIGFAVIGGAS